MSWRALTALAVSAAGTGTAVGVAQETAPARPREALGSLQPGDLVRLHIWREPDLSGDFLVDENGVATLPRLGPVSVIQQSVPALKQALVARYSTYLRNPAIEVIALRRVNVLGAVKNPGLYTVDPTMKVADAVSLAGGASPEGRTDRLELHRQQQRVEVAINRETRIADIPLQSGDQVVVPRRGWFSRNTWVVGAALSASTSILYLIANH